MGFREVLNERSTIAALVTSPLDPNYWHSPITEGFCRAGYWILREAIGARIEYEIATRAGEDEFCDFLEPSGRPLYPFISRVICDKKPSPPTAVSLKDGVEVEDLIGDSVYVPLIGGTLPEKYRLFEHTSSIHLPEYVRDLNKLDALHRVLFPLYHHGYLELCVANGIKSEDVREVLAEEFYREFIQWAFDLDPNLGLLEQVRGKVQECGEGERRRIRALIDVFIPTRALPYSLWSPKLLESEESVEKQVVRTFGKWFFDYFARGVDGFMEGGSVHLFTKHANPITFGGYSTGEGKLKLKLLREDQQYRNDAKTFSRMHIEGAKDDFVKSRNQVLDELPKSFRNSKKFSNKSIDTEVDAGKIVESIGELIQHYLDEMVDIKSSQR